MKYFALVVVLAVCLASVHATPLERNKRIFGSIGNWINNKIVQPINNHVISPITDHVINPITGFINGGGGNNNQDYCAVTCQSRVESNGQVLEYWFDRSNGCSSKGFFDNQFRMFDHCCDLHNTCLNSRCCTTNDCQYQKDECDLQYNTCLRNVCRQFYDNEAQFNQCQANSANVVATEMNNKCRMPTSQNRKLCYC
jgi:hypothetical protein